MNDTILIVEDEVRLRFLLRDYLKKDSIFDRLIYLFLLFINNK